MTLLIAGLVFWFAGHLWNRFLPGLYTGLGKAAYGVSAVIIILGVVLMVLGYRAADTTFLWIGPAFFTHINNLLMLFAIFTYMATITPRGTAWVVGNVKNPQLTGFKIWAFAHLLVNGDIASIVLFGGLLAWAVVEVILIKRQGEKFDRSKAKVKSPVVHAAISLGVFIVIGGVHMWIGPSPFGG